MHAARISLLQTESGFCRPVFFVYVRQNLGSRGGGVAMPAASRASAAAHGCYRNAQVGASETDYSLDRMERRRGRESILNEPCRIFCVDSGAAFERGQPPSGAAATQTLEPRLYYLNVPGSDDIPVFDSALADFNFAQISVRTSSPVSTGSAMRNQLTAAH